MRSEGYGSCRVCLSVCLSVKGHLTSGASVRPENTIAYSVGNKGQNICSVLEIKRALPLIAIPKVGLFSCG